MIAIDQILLVGIVDVNTEYTFSKLKTSRTGAGFCFSIRYIVNADGEYSDQVDFELIKNPIGGALQADWLNF
jgi:hypothetical protein